MLRFAPEIGTHVKSTFAISKVDIKHKKVKFRGVDDGCGFIEARCGEYRKRWIVFGDYMIQAAALYSVIFNNKYIH